MIGRSHAAPWLDADGDLRTADWGLLIDELLIADGRIVE
jgi:hypothetical protein